VALAIALYLVTTIVIAIRAEEAYLRATFGDTYDRYAAGTAPDVHRAFSLARAIRNKEYRSATGFVVVSVALLIRAWR
jgi:protein-S-isoprenylcysteine O-methyltransferase Ste14